MSENPFEPGTATLDDGDFGPGAGRYLPPRRAIIFALYTSAGVNVASTAAAAAIDTGTGTPGTSVMLFNLIAIAQFVVLVTCVVLWCMWKHRAAWNIRSFSDTTFEFTPGWAVGWYFIPLLNLVRPPQAMKEILAWSRPLSEREEVGDLSMVNLWWTAWIMSNLVEIFSSVVIPIVGAAMFTALSNGAGIMAALVAARLVEIINDGQKGLARRG